MLNLLFLSSPIQLFPRVRTYAQSVPSPLFNVPWNEEDSFYRFLSSRISSTIPRPSRETRVVNSTLLAHNRVLVLYDLLVRAGVGPYHLTTVNLRHPIRISQITPITQRILIQGVRNKAIRAVIRCQTPETRASLTGGFPETSRCTTR
jgi:hypothetical protein